MHCFSNIGYTWLGRPGIMMNAQAQFAYIILFINSFSENNAYYFQFGSKMNAAHGDIREEEEDSEGCRQKIGEKISDGLDPLED